MLKPLSKAPRRLQNLLLRTQEYTYSLSHCAGTAIPVADALSRAPLPGKKSGEMVHNIFYTPIKTERLAEIRATTQVDDTLTTLKNVIMSGWPTSRVDVPLAAIPYFHYRDELTVQDGIILRGERVVIPTSLRPDIKQKVLASTWHQLLPASCSGTGILARHVLRHLPDHRELQYVCDVQ